MTEIEEKQIKNLIRMIITELDHQKMLKRYDRSAYQKVEILLYNYPTYQKVIHEKEAEIKEISTNGLRKKSPSLVGMHQGNNNLTEEDKINERIEQIKLSIQITQNCVKQIDEALSKIKNDRYYEILPMYYFEHNTLEKIADIYDIDVSTVGRNKSRLINVLKVLLFSDDTILELYA